MTISSLTQPSLEDLEVGCHHIHPTTLNGAEATQTQSWNSFSPTWGHWLVQRWTTINFFLCDGSFCTRMTCRFRPVLPDPPKIEPVEPAEPASEPVAIREKWRHLDSFSELFFCFARLGYPKGSRFLRVLVPMYRTSWSPAWKSTK